jgi:hypothetical protein
MEVLNSRQKNGFMQRAQVNYKHNSFVQRVQAVRFQLQMDYNSSWSTVQGG